MADGQGYRLVPVDHDPFAEPAPAAAPPADAGPLRITVRPPDASPRLVPVDHDPFASSGPSQGRAAVLGTLSGASANFADELAGVGSASGLPALVPGMARLPVGAARLLWDRLAGDGSATTGYEQARDAVRREMDTARAAHPNTMLAGEILGGLLPGAAALKGVGIGTSLGSAILRSGAAGAGTGALAGFGAGEGGATSQATSTLVGAGAGGALGLAAPVVGHVAGSAVRRVLSGRPTVEGTAARQVAQAAARDAVPAEELAARVAALGPEGMVADLGPNLTQRASVLAATPGEAQKIVRSRVAARQEGAGGRVQAATDRALGAESDIGQAVDDVVARRAAAARPLYEAAYAEGDRAIWSPGLERLTASPTVQSAMRAAVSRWRDYAIADGFGAMNPGAMVDRGGQLSFLNGRVPVFPNVQYWDYVKRGLDDMTRSAIKANQTQRAMVLTKLTQQLRGELDNMVGSYKLARDTYAGESALKEAIEAGQGVFKNNVRPGDLRRTLAGMSEGERDAFMQGARGAVADFMGTGRSDAAAARSLFARGYNREKLALIVGPEAAGEMIGTLGREAARATMAGRVTSNSETASRLLGAGDASVRSIPTSAREIAVGLLDRAVQAVRSGRREEIDRAMADILTSTGPARAGILSRVVKEAAAQDRSGVLVRHVRDLATAGQLAGTAPLARGLRAKP